MTFQNQQLSEFKKLVAAGVLVETADKYRVTIVCHQCNNGPHHAVSPLTLVRDRRKNRWITINDRTLAVAHVWEKHRVEFDKHINKESK